MIRVYKIMSVKDLIILKLNMPIPWRSHSSLLGVMRIHLLILNKTRSISSTTLSLPPKDKGIVEQSVPRRLKSITQRFMTSTITWSFVNIVLCLVISSQDVSSCWKTSKRSAEKLQLKKRLLGHNHTG